MIINHNMNALNAHRNMGINNTQSGKSMEKLSSGLRINRAGDDAAGLAISEKMRGQIRGLDQATRNAQDGISMIQTAEGALNETHSILQRMRELAVQSANDTNVAQDRNAIQAEMTQLGEEIDRIGNTTEFNTKKLLNGSMGNATTATTGTIKNSGLLSNNTGASTELGNLIDKDGNNLGIAKDDTITATWSVNGQQYSTTFTVAATTNTVGDLLTNISANTTMSTITVNNGEITGVANGTGYDKQINGFSIEVKSADGARKEAATNALSGFVTGTAAADNRANGSAKLQIGANDGQNMTLAIDDMRASALGVKNLKVESQSQANTAIKVLDSAINKVSNSRSNLGSVQNRLEHTVNNLGTSAENLTSAESRVRDVDMAKEMMQFSKNNILNQAAQAMLSQANQQPQNVLSLLR